MTPLEREIAAAIRAGGPIVFIDFMEAALHDPRHGYYGSGRVRFGRRGDFTTASGLDRFFGEAIAAWTLEVWRRVDRPERFVYAEAGPGTGRLAADVARAVLAADERPARFEVLLVERSPALREVARAAVGPSVPTVAVGILAGERFTGVLVANELVDALAVRRLRRRGTVVEECYVDLDGSGALAERWLAPRDPIPSRTIDLLGGGDYEVETRPAADAWIEEVAGAVDAGAALVVDYGDAGEALFGPHRPRGTIRGFRDHRLVQHPLVDPGLVDLTADVDFAAVAESAARAGFHPCPLISLAAFLAARGLAETVAAAADDAGGIRRLLALKQFLAPGGIGDAMRVLELAKL